MIIYNKKDIDIICDKLKNNSAVFAMKTDTVYGLMCNAYDKKAVDKIYQIKNRDRKKALGIFVDKKIIENGDINKIVDIEKFNYDLFYDLANKYSPGAITFILNKNINNKYLNYLSLNNKIGIRVPDNNILLEIIERVDFPLAQTSLNFSGETVVKTFNEVQDKFSNKIDFFVKSEFDDIDNNDISSTIIEINKIDYKIIRKGSIDFND